MQIAEESLVSKMDLAPTATTHSPLVGIPGSLPLIYQHSLYWPPSHPFILYRCAVNNNIIRIPRIQDTPACQPSGIRSQSVSHWASSLEPHSIRLVARTLSVPVYDDYNGSAGERKRIGGCAWLNY